MLKENVSVETAQTLMSSPTGSWNQFDRFAATTFILKCCWSLQRKWCAVATSRLIQRRNHARFAWLTDIVIQVSKFGYFIECITLCFGFIRVLQMGLLQIGWTAAKAVFVRQLNKKCLAGHRQVRGANINIKTRSKS